jgi:hypothetical protein
VSRIFLSHSSANNAEASAIKKWMASHGWDDVFLDADPKDGLKAGEQWQEALKRAAERCEMVVFLVSPEWARSKWCLAEFLLAKSLNKRIFAAIIAPTPFADIPSEMTAEWQLVDLTAGVRDERITAEVAFASDGLNRLRIGLQQAGLDAKFFAWPPASDPNRAPYRGLKPLEAEDAGIFFGRDGQIVEALDRLRGLREAAPPRLLVILGASGAGKSSFLRAGLLPRLARDDRHFLPLPIVRPERAAISGENGLVAALTEALKRHGQARPRAAVREAVTVGAAALQPLLAALAQSAAMKLPTAPSGSAQPKPPTLILPIDQGEELFLAEGAAEAQAFLSLLRDLLITDAPALTALVTIRSDNYERLQMAKPLEGLRQSTLSLPPMPQGNYAEVIRGPARRLEGTVRKLAIEDRLSERLLADIEAGGAKDALPLLAFTLERRYAEYGGDGDLKLSEYETLGGIAGSIEAAVERAFKAADSDARIPKDRQARLTLLRRGLIPWLAGIDPDTKSPRRRVARLSEIPAETRPLIDLLVEQRLLSTDVAKDTGETTIEPAHEALLRQWGLLQGWLSEDSEVLHVLEMLSRSAEDWINNDRANAWLLHEGERLAIAESAFSRFFLVATTFNDKQQGLVATSREYLRACYTADLEQRHTTDYRRLRESLIAGEALPLLLERLQAKTSEAQSRVYAHELRFGFEDNLWSQIQAPAEEHERELRYALLDEGRWHPSPPIGDDKDSNLYTFPCCGRTSMYLHQIQTNGCKAAPINAISHQSIKSPSMEWHDKIKQLANEVTAINWENMRSTENIKIKNPEDIEKYLKGIFNAGTLNAARKIDFERISDYLRNYTFSFPFLGARINKMIYSLGLVLVLTVLSGLIRVLFDLIWSIGVQ